jgi:hypothetical protein
VVHLHMEHQVVVEQVLQVQEDHRQEVEQVEMV